MSGWLLCCVAVYWLQQAFAQQTLADEVAMGNLPHDRYMGSTSGPVSSGPTSCTGDCHNFAWVN